MRNTYTLHKYLMNHGSLCVDIKKGLVNGIKIFFAILQLCSLQVLCNIIHDVPDVLLLYCNLTNNRVHQNLQTNFLEKMEAMFS